MHLKDLKSKNPQELLKIAEDLEIENAGTLRKQDMIFAILKQMAMNNDAIYGEGVLEILQDGFGFLRSPDANYLPGPDDIYVSPGQIKKNSLRTGDTVEGEMRAPRESERYFAITKIDKINFEDAEKTKQRINFDNLTPLYPEEKLNMEIDDPTVKDSTNRVMDLIAPLPSRFINEIPEDSVEKNEIGLNENDDFEFNQDNSVEFDEEYRSPGWDRYKKNKMLKWKK